jgi:hypothetical protein
VLLQEPLDLDAHALGAEVDRFACGPREPGEPPLAGFGDDATGHTIAGPDASPAEKAKAPDDAATQNRRLSSDTPAAVQWHPDDSETLARLKRPAQKFKWKNPGSVRALRDLMLALFALDRVQEASSLASFLASRTFDGDAERWEPVESALGLLHWAAQQAGDEAAAERAADRLREAGIDALRLEGALLDDIRDNALLQPSGTGPRREWELQWLGELLVLHAALGADADRIDAIAARKSAIRDTLG